MIYCTLENDSEEVIYVTQEINSNWNAIANLDSLLFYRFGSYKTISSIIIPNVMSRLYELKPNEKKVFNITAIFNSEKYDEQIVNSIPLIFEYYKYDDKFSSIFKENHNKTISLESEQFFIMNQLVSFNKRS